MTDAVTLEIDDRELRRNLRLLGDHVIGRTMAAALNRTAFEVLDAEKSEVKQTFQFASGRTRDFLAGKGAFQFKRATANRLEVDISPRRKTERILRAHQKGAIITGRAGTRLAYRGKLAVPVTARRGPRGRVVTEDLPFVARRGQSSLEFKRGSRAFVAGRAILQREKLKRRRGRTRSKAARVLFALVAVAKLKPVYEFYNVARKTAEREFPRKAVEEFRKVRFGR